MKLPFSNYVKAHHVSHAALVVGALVAAVVFFIVGAGIRLLLGPVSLGPLAGPLANALQSALPGITLKYDQAAIEWTRDEGRVNLVVLGTRILDQDGQVVVQAPKADIDLAAAPFLKGQFLIKRITLVGVKLTLVHTKDGRIRLGGDKGADDVLARLNNDINANGSSTSSLDSFAVRDADIGVFDEVTGLSARAPHASLALSAKGRALSFDADVEMSGRAAHVKADVALPADKGPISGSATVSHLDLRALGARAPMFKPLANIALLVDLTTRFTVAPGGHLTRADFDLGAAGTVPANWLKDKTLHVRHLRLVGTYDGVTNHLALNGASLDSSEASVMLRGGSDFHYDPQGHLLSIDAALDTSRAAFNMPGFFKQAVAFQALQLRGTWQAVARQFDILKFTATAPAFAFDAKGSVTLGEKGQAPGIAVSGALRPLAVSSLLRYWPITIEADTRDWIANNVYAGTLGPFIFETHIPVGMLDQPILPDDALKLSFAMDGVEGNYVRGLTHLSDVAGSATLLGDTFTADFNSGRVGNIQIRGGHAVIPTLHVTGTVGTFSAHADGTMGDIMNLIDMKPLNYPTRFGVDPAQTKGQASVDLAFKVPMLADLPVDDVGISVHAAVSDFAVTLGKTTRLTDGAVNFDIDNSHLHQTGVVNLADSRLTVDWTEDFKTTQPITTKLNVKGTLTEGGRAALNIGLTSILTGPIPFNANIEGNRGELRTADATLDLTQAVIAIPFINLGKAAGAGASGRVQVNFGPKDTVHDETIHLSGPTLSANGTAQFNADGELTVLSFPSLKMGALNDLSLTLARGPAGDDYTLRGHSLDGSMIGRNGTGSAGAGAVPVHDENMTGPFHIDARLDRFAMLDNVAIAPFNLDLSGVGTRPGTLSLSGSLSKTATITGGIENTPAGRKLTLNAGDAGLLLRGLFKFEAMRGGKLSVTATLPGRATDAQTPNLAADYQGTLSISTFTMVNQPLLARLFSAGSLTGVGDLMGGDGISVDQLDVPFSSKNNVISVHDSRARGTIGATADGYIDRPKNQLALKGSLIPAYGLNSVLGNIPLLGNVLVSKKGEGIFGVTYSATGNADQPKIDVNPVSMLTPGILRRIWEGHIPTVANAPSNAPQAAPTAPAAAPN